MEWHKDPVKTNFLYFHCWTCAFNHILEHCTSIVHLQKAQIPRTCDSLKLQTGLRDKRQRTGAAMNKNSEPIIFGMISTHFCDFCVILFGCVWFRSVYMIWFYVSDMISISCAWLRTGSPMTSFYCCVMHWMWKPQHRRCTKQLLPSSKEWAKSVWSAWGLQHLQKMPYWVVVSKIFIFDPTWGNDPIWLIFCRWVETCWNHQLAYWMMLLKHARICQISAMLCRRCLLRSCASKHFLEFNFPSENT